MNEPAPPRLAPELLDAAVELMGRSGRRGTISVRRDGFSMVPNLHAGQLLAVDFDPDALSSGDLLLFRQEDYLVVHRLLGRSAFADGRAGLRTRGDGRPGLDARLDPARVVGRVFAVRDDGGWWDLRGRGARVYGALVAWHDLAWAALGVAAGWVDRRLVAVGLRGRLRAAIGWLDGWLLRQLRRLLFRGLHARCPDPCAEEPRGD